MICKSMNSPGIYAGILVIEYVFLVFTVMSFNYELNERKVSFVKTSYCNDYYQTKSQMSSRNCSLKLIFQNEKYHSHKKCRFPKLISFRHFIIKKKILCLLTYKKYIRKLHTLYHILNQ